MTAKEFIKILKKNGFVELRQEGSHKFFENRKTNKRTTVHMHKKDLPAGLLNARLRQAGLK